MTSFTLQIILILGVAFLLGAILGVVLRGWFLSKAEQQAKSYAASAGSAQSPAPEPAPAKRKPAPQPDKDVVTSGASDNLQLIKGVGAVIEKKLNAMGVHRFEQIAAWNEADIERINGALRFRGRIEREHWVQQAAQLAADK